MVNHINDSANLKPMESTESRLKTKLQETVNFIIDSLNLSDSVSSTNSKQLEALKASLQDIPEINAARVLYFKTEIELGNYQIQSDAIARNMLQVEPA